MDYRRLTDVLMKNVVNRPELSDLFRKICYKKQIPPQTVFKKKSKRELTTFVRSDFCKQAVYKYGYTLVKTAEFLDVNASTVLRLLQKKTPS